MCRGLEQSAVSVYACHVVTQASLIPKAFSLNFFCNNNFGGRKERISYLFPASKIVTAKGSEREGLGTRLKTCQKPVSVHISLGYLRWYCK